MFWTKKLKSVISDYRDYIKFQLSKRHRRNILGHIDTGYLSQWDRSEIPYIQKEYRLIEEGRIHPWTLFEKIERFRHDQTVRYTNEPLRRFEPTIILKKFDKITNEWLVQQIQINTGRSRSTPKYISIGTGTSTPDEADTGLDNEVSRKGIIANGGFIDFIGHNELYGVLFPLSLASNMFTESGLHTTSDPETDITVCRNVYSPGLSHTQNQDSIGVNIIIQHRAF